MTENEKKKKPLLVEDRSSIEVQSSDGTPRIVRTDPTNRGHQEHRDAQGNLAERSHPAPEDNDREKLSEGKQILND